MNYGDKLEVKEDMDGSACPFCGESDGYVIADYTGLHEREVMIHCLNEKCDNLYIRVYNFAYIIKLNKEIITVIVQH